MESKERRYKVSQCEKRWFTLNKVEGNYQQRFCEQCNKHVHWCNTEDEIKNAIKNKWCIATENPLVYSDKTQSQRAEKNALNSQPYAGVTVGNAESYYKVDTKNNDSTLRIEDL